MTTVMINTYTESTTVIGISSLKEYTLDTAVIQLQKSLAVSKTDCEISPQ